MVGKKRERNEEKANRLKRIYVYIVDEAGRRLDNVEYVPVGGTGRRGRRSTNPPPPPPPPPPGYYPYPYYGYSYYYPKQETRRKKKESVFWKIVEAFGKADILGNEFGLKRRRGREENPYNDYIG